VVKEPRVVGLRAQQAPALGLEEATRGRGAVQSSRVALDLGERRMKKREREEDNLA
jgi:hypothetical protein